MKNKFLLLFFAFLAKPLCGGITRLNQKDLEKIKDNLTEFHLPTSSGQDSPKPDVSKLKSKENLLLIAKMDSFGLHRYFEFKTNDDVNTLVQGVQNGGGWDVSWYYVEKIVELPT